MRRLIRLCAAGIVLATAATSGLVIGPPPQPARALVALAVADSLTMKHDRTAVVSAPGVMANDVTLLGTTASLVWGVSHGTLNLQSNGGYTYSPDPGYVGSDQFRYRLSGLVPTAANVTITITNATPTANPDAYSFSGSTLVVAAPGVLANDTDSDGDALVAQLVGGITGSLNLYSNGGFQYTPGGGFSGSATFTYRVWDGVAWSGTTTVTLTRPAPTPTPTPTPIPTPTPVPTPKPTATPAPIPSLPIPSLPLPSLPLPSIPLATPVPPLSTPIPQPSVDLPLVPTPVATGSPNPDPEPSGTPAPGATAPGSGPTGTGSDPADPGSDPGAPSGQTSGSGGVSRPDLSLNLPTVNLGVGTFGVLAGLEIWAVPAAVIGGPGLLFLLWVALQTAGATVWIPAARRLRDDEKSKARGRVRA
jgi:hypothetical protein